jgi:uncharacterized protein (DUF362 family)
MDNETNNSRIGHCKCNRRRWLIGAGTAVAAGAAVSYPFIRKWQLSGEPVFLARNQRYDGPLVETITRGLEAVGFDVGWVRGRKVLLKPNFVEPNRRSPQMTTNPVVVLAAAEVFRRWGAEVVIGEAPGHMRDSELALTESGMADAMQGEKLRFSDLNYGEFRKTRNVTRCSPLADFTFPTDILSADLIVSMPKLKTHHWMGMTAAMKNLYGTLPGQIYGWPKNVLHLAGIPQTVVDINASLPPRIAIVDGILCMEGDGPILGTPKPMGLLAIGVNPTAVDATLARIIGFDPDKIPYLALAKDRLGPIDDSAIAQRGEHWEELVSPFTFVDVPHLRAMRFTEAPPEKSL